MSRCASRSVQRPVIDFSRIGDVGRRHFGNTETGVLNTPVSDSRGACLADLGMAMARWLHRPGCPDRGAVEVVVELTDEEWLCVCVFVLCVS